MDVSRVQEVSLVNHVPHPLAVVHVTLTSLYAGEFSRHMFTSVGLYYIVCKMNPLLSVKNYHSILMAGNHGWI